MGAWADRFKAMLLGLYPPGAFSSDDAGEHVHLVEVDADALEAAQDVVDQLEAEAFPHGADQLISEWEGLLGEVPTPGASLAERRAACVARWRAASSSSLRDLRAQLAPVLNPEYQFRDDHDDEDVSWRFEQHAGNGIVNEVGSMVVPSLGAVDDGRWDATHATHYMALLDLVDRADDFHVEVLVNAEGVGHDCRAGLVVYESDTDAIWYGIDDIGGVKRLRVGRIEDGVVYPDMADEAVPALPCWLVCSREAGEYKFRYGVALVALTEQWSWPGVNAATSIAPRKVGWFVANDAATAVSIDIDETRVRYGRQENNLEIIEVPLVLVPTDAPEWKFFAFVHRHPDDAGTYRLVQAQRIATRAKQAHTLLVVGESDCFRCDDPESLTDRDILGS